MSNSITIRRRFLADKYTVGSLFINGVYYCDTLEDKVRDYNKDGDLLDEGEGKVYGETAIPYGAYDLVLTFSPKFNRLLPLVENVKHFEGIRLHGGSHAGHSEGCILLGENKVKGGLINSSKYVDDLVNWMKVEKLIGRDTVLEII
jgi:hypothetical protein